MCVELCQAREAFERCNGALVASKRCVQELKIEILEQEYQIRKEISKEFAEQVTEIEDEHEYV